MHKLIVSLVVLVACSKQGPPPAPVDTSAERGAGVEADVAQDRADAAQAQPEVELPQGDAAQPQGDAAQAQGDVAKGPGVDACERGDKDGCAAAADVRIARYTALQNTIYSVAERADLPAIADPFAVAERACELGDGWSCAFLADEARGGSCGPGWEELGGDAAKAKAYEAKGRPLLEALCEGTGPACDRLIEAARAGCDGTVDLERARRLIARKLEIEAEACRGGKGDGCVAVLSSCRMYGPLAVAPGAGPEVAPGPLAVAPLRARAVRASTVLPPWKGYRFGAEQVGDGALDTSWQPLDKKRGGVGQWIELDLGGDFVVAGIELGNGLQRKDALGDLFVMNNRARRVLVSFDGGAPEHVELGADERGLVARRFAGRVTRTVRVTIEAIHRGSKWNDLALSEVVVLGAPAHGATVGAACEAPATHYRAGCERGDLGACRSWREVATGTARDEATERVFALAGEACRAATVGGKGFERCAEAASVAPDPVSARDLRAHGCSGGDDSACEAFGCPALADEEPGRLHGEAVAKPEVCREGCERGAIATCLGLVGGSVFGLEGDPSWGEVTAMARRVARCDDAAACEKAGLAAQPAPRTTPEMPDAAGHFEAYASLARACELGAREACEAAAVSLETLSGPEAEVVALRKRGCELGDGYACAGVGEDGARKKTVALLGARCEAGEADACQAALGVATGDDASKIEMKLAALDRAACKANEVARCHDVEVRLARSGALCASKGECEVMCATAEELTSGSFVRGMSAEDLGKVQAIVKAMTSEDIVERCFDVILADPCSCGCC